MPLDPPRPFRAFALALGLAASALVASPAAADVVHVVARGQTLVAIAKRYRTTPDAIREANGLRERQLIHPGLELTIPGVPPPRSKEGASKTKDKAAASKDSSKDRAKGAKSKAKSKTRADDDDEDDDEKDAKGNKGKGKGAKAKTAKDAKGKDAKGKGAKGKGKGKGAKDDDTPASYAARPKKAGFVTMVRGTEKLAAQLLTRGQLNRASLPGLTKILRHVASDSKKAVDPRLAYLIGLVSDHFGGRTIRVVSGYRPFNKKQYTPHSNHNHGKAMDFAIDGVPNTVVRDYCRTLRDAGVGYYPNSTFVHLDVRAGKAYWVDYSGPGEAPRYQKGGKGKVDESAADVESTGDTGSPATQPAAPQPAETKQETAAPAAPKPTSRAAPGLRTPSPSKADSPTPAGGQSADPSP